MGDLVNEFLLMIQFFTRIPVKKSLPCEPDNFKRGVVFLPFIGFLIGGLQYGTVYLLENILPGSIIGVIVVLLPVIITGGLHIDGLGDTCDGFFAFTEDQSKIIDIMKDSGAGTYAICSIVFNILFQYVTVAYIIQQQAGHVLLVITMFSKIFVLFTAMWGKPAKKHGSGNIFIANMSFTILIIATIYSLMIGSFTISLATSLWLLLGGTIGSILFYCLCKHKISGITGDTLGATQEIATMIMLTIYCSIIM